MLGLMFFPGAVLSTCIYGTQCCVIESGHWSIGPNDRPVDRPERPLPLEIANRLQVPQGLDPAWDTMEMIATEAVPCFCVRYVILRPLGTIILGRSHRQDRVSRVFFANKKLVTPARPLPPHELAAITKGFPEL